MGEKKINHGAWWLGLIIGSIATVVLSFGLMLPVYWVLWGLAYAGTAAGNHSSNERIRRGQPDRRWNGIGPKLEDHQKPSWW